jgi:hypothetical protein
MTEQFDKLVEASRRNGYIQALIDAEKLIHTCETVRDAQIKLLDTAVRRIKGDERKAEQNGHG